MLKREKGLISFVTNKWMFITHCTSLTKDVPKSVDTVMSSTQLPASLCALLVFYSLHICLSKAISAPLAFAHGDLTVIILLVSDFVSLGIFQLSGLKS